MAWWIVALAGIPVSGSCPRILENLCQENVDGVSECHADNSALDFDTGRAVHTPVGTELDEAYRVEHDARLPSDARFGAGCSAQAT